VLWAVSRLPPRYQAITLAGVVQARRPLGPQQLGLSAQAAPQGQAGLRSGPAVQCSGVEQEPSGRTGRRWAEACRTFFQFRARVRLEWRLTHGGGLKRALNEETIGNRCCREVRAFIRRPAALGAAGARILQAWRRFYEALVGRGWKLNPDASGGPAGPVSICLGNWFRAHIY